MNTPAPPTSDAIALRGLADVIRKHGTCAPMALEVIADRIDLRTREIAAQPGEGYDRDLIADMLDGFIGDTCAWSVDSVREQARLLREAENREHRAQTVRLPSPPHVADALDGELFRYLERHAAGWFSGRSGHTLPRIVIKPYFSDRDGDLASLLIGKDDTVGVCSLRTAIRIMQEAEAARAEAGESGNG